MRTSISSISRSRLSGDFRINASQVEEDSDHATFLGVFYVRAQVPFQEPLDLRVFSALAHVFVSQHRLGELRPIGNSNGKILLNSAYANTFNDIGASLFGIIVIAAIFGTSILRDFQRDTYQILFTKPISKFGYLGGRWAGSFVTTLFAFSGMMFGTFLGTFAPWADHTRIGPNHLWNYLQPFLSVIVVQIFFVGSGFFVVAALTRKIFIVYLQGVALFMLYVIGITVFFATRSLERFWSGIFDPIGFILFDDVTRYWTVIEKNTLFVTWSPLSSMASFYITACSGSAVGSVGAWDSVWAFFPMSVEALTARSQGRRAAKAKEQELAEACPCAPWSLRALPSVHQRSLRPRPLPNIFRSRAFASAQYSPRHYLSGPRGPDRRVRHQQRTFRRPPRRAERLACHLISWLQAVEGSALLFLFIVAALYAAELLWREREAHFDGIHDALPMRESTDWLSRLTAIVVVEVILLAFAMFVGILMQTIEGYYHYELLQYFKELYVVTFPQVLTFILLALFVQTVVSNKFVGYGILIGMFVLMPILYSFGWENTLYLVGQTPAYTYSDMNGYGHFVPALFWSITYWFAICGVLGVISIAFARRGAEDSLRARTRLALQRAPRLAPVALLFAIIAVGAGSWYFYNAHVLNEYLDSDARRGIQADYERKFKQYENLLQPKVTAVDATINIYPERRSFDGSVRMTLENKTGQPIPQIHITDQKQSVTNLKFDRPFHLVSSAPREYVLHLCPGAAPGTRRDHHPHL